MYGPSSDIAQIELPSPFPTADNGNIELSAAYSSTKPVPLEQVELEILLSMKIADGQEFEKAVQATMVCSGNEYLFSFPSERFPISCSGVACVRLAQDNEQDGDCIYLYQETPGGAIQIADPSELDEEFTQFAQSFIAVMEQLRDLH